MRADKKNELQVQRKKTLEAAIFEFTQQCSSDRYKKKEFHCFKTKAVTI